MAANPLDLLGDSLLRGADTVSRADTLSGKVVGLYFSARSLLLFKRPNVACDRVPTWYCCCCAGVCSLTTCCVLALDWCPPCRAFTPRLAETYRKVLADGKAFEIVFVSSDKDEASFREYFGHMPWLALPYSARGKKDALSRLFQVEGIPTLVLLNADGTLISTDGRSSIAADPHGAKYPWHPPTLSEALGASFSRHGTEEEVPVSAIAGKTLGLYFSAHWCGPCKAFTPQLVQTYNAINAAHAGAFEIVFVSADRDERSYKQYLATMPWLSIAFDDPRVGDLSARFKVEGIPMLVLIDSNGKVITTSGTDCVRGDPTGENFPWARKLVESLDGPYVSLINSSPAVLCLCEEASAAEKARLKDVLAGVAAGHENVVFFIADKASRMSAMLRTMTMQLNLSQVTLALFDVRDNGTFYISPADTVTSDTLSAFLEGYNAGALEPRQLERH